MCYKLIVTQVIAEDKAMTLYSIALFLHVVGALLLFVTLTVEGIALRQLRTAVTNEAAQTAAAMFRLNRIVGPVSALGVLVPGLYMTATTWGWVGWIVVALVSWVLIAVLGSVNGIRILALDRSGALLTGIRNPMFLISWLTRVGVALGVVLLMTVKPGAVVAVAAIALAAAAGAALGVLMSKTRQTPGSDGRHEREGQVA
jgi:hypothetical protein